MTSSAPRARTRFAFEVLHTPVTAAPNALASCTAYVPTPPAAPMMSTFCPGWSLPASRRPLRAVIPEIGTAAACLKLRFAGLGREALRLGAGVLCEGAIARPVHLVTLLEPDDIFPGSLDGTSGIHATNADLGLAEAKAHDANQIGKARHQMPDAWIYARSMHADEQLVVPGMWFFDIAKLEHIGRAVFVLNDGFHGCRYFLPLLPSVRRTSLLSSRCPIALSTDCRVPSQDEMEDDECENTNEGAWREGDRLVGQMPL